MGFYRSVRSLFAEAIILGHRSLTEVHRKKMYDFFMSLKQPDGSFLVSHHGEVDVR